MDKSVEKWIKDLDDDDFFSLVQETKTGLDGLSEEKARIVKEKIRRFSPEKRLFGKSSLSGTVLRFCGQYVQAISLQIVYDHA